MSTPQLRAVPSVEEVGAGRDLTDLGNAERIVDRHGRDLRYCHPWKAWLAWDGRRWRPDDTGDAVRRAKDATRAILTEAASEPDDDRRERLAKWAHRSQAAARIGAALALAESEQAVVVRPEELDADAWLLNLENGTLDLRTGRLRPHERAELITKLAPVCHDPAAEAPLWLACLDRWLPDPAVREFMQRAVGYALAGDVSAQVLFLLHGGGANGKSVFLRVLLDALGDYAMQAAPELLLAKRLGAVPTDVAELAGRRLVASVEVDDGRRLAEALVKSMTGGDRLKARRLFHDFFEFTPTHTLFIAANHRPQVRGQDEAMWRRIRLVPFEVTIPERERDPRLVERLAGERAGILQWALLGCLAWQESGLEAPAAVREATAAYRAESDPLAGWHEERCVTSPEARTLSGDLWMSYLSWAGESGEEAVERRRFNERLDQLGHPAVKGAKGKRFRLGIGLLPKDAR